MNRHERRERARTALTTLEQCHLREFGAGIPDSTPTTRRLLREARRREREVADA